MQNGSNASFAGCTTQCEKDLRRRNMRCGFGKSRRQIVKALNKERKQRGELHSSGVWPPDVCLQLSRGCWCWLSACSGSHRVQICCLGGTRGASKTDGARKKTSSCHEESESIIIIYRLFMHWGLLPHCTMGKGYSLSRFEGGIVLAVSNVL